MNADRRRMLASLVLLALLLASFLPPQRQAAARADSLLVYTALEDDQLARYLPVFKAAHPEIDLQIVREATGIITARLLAEKDNPRADVVWGLAATSLLVADNAGMLEGYAPQGLERVNPLFRDDANPPRWVGIDVWMAALCVNTVELQAKKLPLPESWRDLTDPVYKGVVVMPNPASSGTGFLDVSSWLQLWGEAAGWQYMDALNENIGQYTHSGSKPCKQAGTGEYTIGVSFDYRGLTGKANGEPITVVFPTEGSGWDLESNALVKKPSIKPAAQTFLDWAIGDPIMREYARSYAVTSVPTDVPPIAGMPADPFKQMSKNDFKWAATNRDRILEEWLRRYDSKSEPK